MFVMALSMQHCLTCRYGKFISAEIKSLYTIPYVRQFESTMGNTLILGTSVIIQYILRLDSRKIFTFIYYQILTLKSDNDICFNKLGSNHLIFYGGGGWEFKKKKFVFDFIKKKGFVLNCSRKSLSYAFQTTYIMKNVSYYIKKCDRYANTMKKMYASRVIFCSPLEIKWLLPTRQCSTYTNMFAINSVSSFCNKNGNTHLFHSFKSFHINDLLTF